MSVALHRYCASVRMPRCSLTTTLGMYHPMAERSIFLTQDPLIHYIKLYLSTPLGHIFGFSRMMMWRCVHRS